MGIEQLQSEGLGMENLMREANFMQAHLIQASGEKPDDWIGEHAGDFRVFIEKNPEILKLYRQDPEKAVQIIKDHLN